MALKSIQFLAVIFTALSLVPGGAHLFVLLNKIDLAAEQYYVVQGTYRGWNLFALVLIPAIFLNLVLAIIQRRQAVPLRAALLAFLCLAATLVVFFVWTEPANRATDYWTTVPANWRALRDQWEYSHAANAIITFAALCAATLSVLTHKE